MKRFCSIVFILIFNLCFAQINEQDKVKTDYEKLVNHFENNNSDSVFYFTKKIFNTTENNIDDKTRLYAASVFSHTFKDNSKSFKYFDILEEKLLKSKISNELLGTLYMYKANRYFNSFSDRQALTYYLKADSIHNTNNIKSFTSVMTINGIAEVLMRSRSDDSPLKISQVLPYLNKGYKDSDSLNLLVPKAIFLYKKGEILYQQDSLFKAKTFFKESLKISEKINNYVRVALVNNFLSKIFEQREQIDSALVYQKKAVYATTKIQDKRVILSENLRLGYLYNILKHYDTGLKHLLLANKTYNSIVVDRKEVKHNIEFQLAESYFGKKDFKKGYEYLLKSKNTMEEIQLVKNEEKVNELEAKYQTEKKETEIQILKSKNKLTEREKVNQKNILTSGILIVFLAGVFLFFLYMNNKKHTKKLKKLYTNISHEFRTPLTLINGPVENQLNKENIAPEDKNDLLLIKKNANRLLHLVNQMLDISMLDAGHLKINYQKGNLHTLLTQLMASYSYKAQEKDITLISSIQKKLSKSYFDEEVIDKITSNLLSNAVKYTPNNGEILVTATQDTKNIFISVSNTIENAHLKNTDKFFDRFYQQNTNSEGVGVGLALVKELINAINGSILVNKKDNQIVFNVSLPLLITLEKDIEENTSAIETENYTLKPKLVPHASNAPLVLEESLLIVEDNDELRSFITSLFNTTYTIIEAKNGKEGINKALEYVPDIIISDIMMPIVSGIELCNELKYNEITSHIPIILLTAKSGDTNEIEGLKTGAEAYITKPFNINKLKLTAKNLLLNRKILKDKFKKSFNIQPDLAVNTTENEFLKRLKNVIEKNITNPDFKTEQFCKEMLMSRMQLHRKLKSLTNMTTSEFLRSQRLKLALPLLQQNQLNTSEIAFKVGYNSVSYFVKSFKQMYGYSPKEYTEKTCNHSN